MGRHTGIMIMPQTIEGVIKAKHWLLSRDKDFRIVYVPVEGQTQKQAVIMANFDLVDKILYRLTFRGRPENVKVFG